MRFTVLATLAVVVLGAGQAASALELKTDEQKTLYALGVALSRNLGSFALTEAELELVKAGLTDGVLNREKKVEVEAFGPKLMELQKSRAAAVASGEKKAAQAFLDKAAGEKGAKKTASGLIMSTLKAGTGESPKPADRVKVHYHGTLTDGSVFDSSVQRGQPATFALGQVIPCWTEGLQLMRVGGKSRLVCPSDIAYGDRGAPPRIRPGAALVFEVELIEILK
jgi:FKBP-type peptidyl-prolyl cis-trans isomerase FkpA/FKBP-type peptidyl-prolyl cis-trans isomerase FklB